MRNIEDACRRHADRIAVSIDGADVGFRELDMRANQMARFFLQPGVAPGDRIVLNISSAIPNGGKVTVTEQHTALAATTAAR